MSSKEYDISVINVITDTSIDMSKMKLTCNDNKIHIKLSNFNNPQIIEGFEQKLSFLITILLQIIYGLKYQNCYTKESFNYFTSNFSHTAIYNIIVDSIKNMDSTCCGIKINRCILKNSKMTGEVQDNIINPLMEYYSGSDLIIKFLSIFKVDTLYEYLFNNSYKIIISDKVNIINKYKKFVNKYDKNINKKNIENKKEYKL